MDASEAILPLMPRKITVADRAHKGTPIMARRITVDKSPAASARPMAICMASTNPRGAKLEKLLSRCSTTQTSPSWLRILRTNTVFPLEGLITWVPIAANTAETTANMAMMYRNRIKGWGSLLPTRSMVPKIPPPLFFVSIASITPIPFL